jgi:hypothetical protein
VALDLPNRHAACIEAQNLVVEPVEPRLPLGDQLRFETAGPIAWHRNLDFAILGQHRLRTRTVAAVAFAATCRIALLVAEMVGQLRPERALDQRLLQLFEKTAISSQVFRLFIVSKKLIQQLRCNRRIGRHVSLLDKVNSQKPAYTFFRTPSIGTARTIRSHSSETLFIPRLIG